MKQRKPLDIVLLCLKVILPVLILLSFVYFSFLLIQGLVDEINRTEEIAPCGGYGMYVFVSHIVLLGVNAVLLIVGAIGLVISKLYKASTVQKKNIRTFVLLTLAPIASQLLYLVITLIVINIG